MYPEKGPVFTDAPVSFKFKWRDLLAMSQICRLLVQRFYFDVRYFCLTEAASEEENATISPAQKRLALRKGACLLLDIIAGAVFVSWMTGGDGERCTGFLSSCLQILRSGVFNLSGTLDWLMDNPAGLKLNKEMAHTLAAFFKHHISLWQMYINYLTSLLEGGDMILCSFSYLGMSFLGALVVDCISLFTVHVHCFYIYMARLFNVQLRGLLALGRFFTGKKWNPLRERVDHISSSVDQLFVGSLIMMVLLFLLPTTVTFYFVFAALHILVKIGQLSFLLLSRWIELASDSAGSQAFWLNDQDKAGNKSSNGATSVLSGLRSVFLGEII